MRRAIDRSACVPFLTQAKPGIDADCGLLYATQVRYIIRSEIKNIAHRKMLILYIYFRANLAEGVIRPSFTMFQARDDFITFDHRPGEKTFWKTSALKRMKGRGDFTEDCAFYSLVDEARVLRFFHAPHEPRSGLSILSEKQDGISAARTAAQKKRQEQNILRRFKPIQQIGKRFGQWAFREALPHYIFYDYKRGAKSVIGLCSSCQHEVEVGGVRHNKTDVCPHCGAAVTLKSRAKFSVYRDQGTVQIIQRLSENEIVLRIFKLRRVVSEDKTVSSMHESMRIILAWNRWGRITREEYYNACGQAQREAWRKGCRTRYYRYKERFEDNKAGNLFTKNLSDVLAGSPWQYCQIDRFYLSNRKPLEAEPYLNAYVKKPFLEYLVKLGLFRLAGDIVYERDGYGYRYGERKPSVNEKGKNLREILGVEMEDIPMLRAINAGHVQLEILQELRRMHLRPDQELLDWCGSHEIKKLHDVLVPLRFVTAHKLMRYVQGQFHRHLGSILDFKRQGYYRAAETLSDYRDYLCMCEGLGYDLSNPFVLFPRDLPAAHDKVTNLSEPETAEAYQRQISGMYPELTRRYAFEKDGYMIVAPKTVMEIQAEGSTLHHCVGSYVKRVVQRESCILFLRRSDRPEEPFCTLEVCDGVLVQYRAEYNHAPPSDAEAFLREWVSEVLEHQDEREYYPLAA